MDRLIVDINADCRVTVTGYVDGGSSPTRTHEPVAWTSPLDDVALEDLRWYVEDYLRAPFAVYEERGARVADALAAYGEALFTSVFSASAALDAYAEVRSRGGLAEIVVRTSNVRVLGLPWELIRDPGMSEPLALSGVAVTRMLPSQVAHRGFESLGERLRVLMVIARPDMARDVGYHQVARRLLPLLEGVGGTVELTVLRPPTFAQLERALAEASRAGVPFQVLHFDGHGSFAATPSFTGARAPSGPDSGMLLFETEHGGVDVIGAERVGQVLDASRVPLVVLNASQSGRVGDALETGIATRLLQGGVSSVVAMAYSVYAVAAAEFMAVFYERLFAGDTVSLAVAAGRTHLAVENRRPSPKGRLPLSDWMVPVHYARQAISFPHLRRYAAPVESRSLETIMQRVRAGSAGSESASSIGASQASLTAAGGLFVGRDGVLYRLDNAARLQHVVLVHGPGGVGKTELAKAFARWWRDTSGVDQPDWIVWHSFEPGVATFGLDSAVTAAGLHLFGPEFALLDPDQRREALFQVLERHRILLIWDNFDTAYSVPDPADVTPPLNDQDRAEFAEFLARVRARAKGAIVITSRSQESWMGADVRRIELTGFSVEEAAEYTDLLLQAHPETRPLRQKRAFGELLEWLGGHPLSMRLTLPRLGRSSPEELLAQLRGLAPAQDEAETIAITRSLATVVANSFAHLSAEHRDALTVLALVRGVADANVLGVFSELEITPTRFRGLHSDDWERILQNATELGLLTAVAEGLFRLHPALSGHLAARWRAAFPSGYEADRDQTTRALLEAYARFGDGLTQQMQGPDAAAAVSYIELHRRTFGMLLGYALDGACWRQAQDIVQPLNEYWDLRGLSIEAHSWVDRARTVLESHDSAPPDLTTPAGALWLFMVGSEANRQTTARRFDNAEATYLKILSALQRLDPSARQSQRLAAVHHQIGVVAQLRGNLSAAEEWYRRSLDIFAELGDRPNMASSYYQLGRLAQEHGNLDAAEDWYRRALSIEEEQGNRLGAALSYQQLGTIAQGRGDLEASAELYRRSLSIKEEFGDRPGMARSYHQLGRLARERGDLEAAEDWYRRSLTIDESLGNARSAAVSYHQLGILAQDRGLLEAAEEWYQRSLRVSEELGDRPAAAVSFHQLGILAQDRGQLEAAEEWYRRSLSLSEELGNRANACVSYHQLGRVAQERGQLEAAEEWYRRSLRVSEELGDRSQSARLYHQLGILAQERGQLEAAEEWYQRSLSLSEELGNRANLARTHAQLGRLARDRSDLPRALEHAVRSVSLFDQIPHPVTGTGPRDLRELTRELGIDALEAVWRRITGNVLNVAVRAFVTAPDDPGSRDDQVSRTVVQYGARGAAHRLAPAYGGRLAGAVEAAIHARSGEKAPSSRRGSDPLAVASLIVEAAELAWTTYRELRENDTASPALDQVARRVRATLRETQSLDRDAEHAVMLAVEETLRVVRPAR